MALTTRKRAKPGTAVAEVPAGVWSDLYHRASQDLALQPWDRAHAAIHASSAAMGRCRQRRNRAIGAAGFQVALRLEERRVADPGRARAGRARRRELE